jgi:hypothetical protein
VSLVSTFLSGGNWPSNGRRGERGVGANGRIAWGTRRTLGTVRTPVVQRR